MFLLETTHSEQSPKSDQFGEISYKAHKTDCVSFTHKIIIILQAGSQVCGSVINPASFHSLNVLFKHKDVGAAYS